MNARPSPDELLKHVQQQERQAGRGKLVVFFGAAPGVGKTYAMLEAARTERDLRRDVVIGIVETHGRYETASLVLGLEMLPRRREAHRGVVLEELDLDGAIVRRPGLLLIDELAHTNAPGSRHPKRWQDVEEVLDNGIDVYTTMNVQHVASLNDVVAQITGIVVRETVPDKILEQASEIRLVDLPPDELLERLNEGKVYLPDQAGRAAQGFFRKGNLIALRELALRRTAERVDAQMRVYRTEHGIHGVWATADRVLVGVSPSPASARLLRAACRMAGALHAPWTALHVETPASLRLTGSNRARLADNLRLAEQLGAETATIAGQSAAEETIRYARAHNVTKIVVGKPTRPAWRTVLRQSFLEDVVRWSGDIDVYVISGGEGDAPPARGAKVARPVPAPGPFAAAAVASAVSTSLAWVMFGRTRFTDVVMVHLLAIVLVAMRFGYGPSLLSAVLSVFLIDFFFVPPYFSLAISDFQNVITFGTMLFVAVVISSLTERIREQVAAVRSREQRTANLYAITRELARTRSTEKLAEVAAAHVEKVFDAEVTVLLAGNDPGRGQPRVLAAAPSGTGAREHALDDKDIAAAEWVFSNGKPAGLATETLASSASLFLPLRTGQGALGVLAVTPRDTVRLSEPDTRALLDVFVAQIASALERARLGEGAERVQIEIEAERLRSSLLSSVSHDLRTPLASIAGAASALVDGETIAEADRRELAQTIAEEAQRLGRLVRNLLDMSKLAAGVLRVKKEWQPLEEVVGAALTRMDESLRGRPVKVRLEDSTLLVPIDAVLIEQVVINLLENATKYTPAGSPLEIESHRDGLDLVVSVCDRGPGIPPDQLDVVFDKFYRLPREREGGGAGLGLAICRGIVAAHGGRIWAEIRRGGGLAMRFTVPLGGVPPDVVMDDRTTLQS